MKDLANIRRGESLMTFDDQVLSSGMSMKNIGTTGLAFTQEKDLLGLWMQISMQLKWSDESMAATRYQIHDAAFSMDKTEKMFLDYRELLGLTLVDKDTHKNQEFYDKRSYLNEKMPDAGRNVPEYGLKIKVTGQSKDRSVGRVEISKK